jgi:hypothetical protein
METKYFEIRDRATRMLVMAMRTNAQHPVEAEALAASGYGRHTNSDTVIMLDLNDCRASNDPYKWNGQARTLPTAHEHIRKNWDTLESGTVLDVRVILGEETTPARGEVYR